MNDFEKIGQYLKTERIKQKITLDELSEITGVNKGQISNLENGKLGERTSPFFIKKIAKGLNADYLKIFNMIGYVDDSDYKKIMNYELNVKNNTGIISTGSTGFINTGAGAIHITIKNGLSNTYSESEIVEMINDFPKEIQEELFEYITFRHMKYKKAENKE